MHSSLTAGSLFPKLMVTDLDENTIELGKISANADWKMVVVYRGKHCPLCTKYLNLLETYKEKIEANGVEIVAVSADSKAQLTEHLSALEVSFPVYYGLTIEQMQSLGLYISNPRSEKETDHQFAEPGMFVINEKGQVQVIDISNGPLARPEIGTLAAGLEFIKSPENDYPIRGTYQ
ncbi:redoxin domain-containing protein [Psychromonas sp. 14N.309.X.WAT.B.A12]|uniref:redoxin domain-containing protein n=1 Tax=unclassified Psychromonas TaxID=2614957 RepID=UPI0025B0DB82|nr:redoxin domain-containing protein [Psychromonas sp. 14N.309.X.WAT.B.A12]MDN2663573.1 redoxin family protein [Psychromonas sp. 14N.309.X.WAT.B.A12]